MDPAELKACRGAERFACVQVWTARSVEPAANFGKTQYADEDRCPGEKYGERTPRSGKLGERRWQSEDTAADHAVDDRGRECPPADCSYEFCSFGQIIPF